MTIIQAQPLKQFGISGPASALDNELSVFDGVTGKKIKAATGIICPSSGRLDLAEIRARDGDGLKLYDDGGNGIFIEDGGDVGIGTITPGAPLHVHGSAVSPSDLFLVNNTASDNYVSCFNLQTPNLTSGQSTNFYMGKGATNKNRAVLRFGYAGSGSDSNYFSFGFYGAGDLFKVMAGGYVGIGVTPTAKLDIDGATIRLRNSRTPSSAGAAGNQGDECWDADFHYRCVATNTWKRTALTTW